MAGMKKGGEKVPESKSRILLRECLNIKDIFEARLDSYCKKTGAKDTFYQNSLVCVTTDEFWDLVDNARQCRCCGQILVSYDGHVKMMSCGKCRVCHYCDRQCQKIDWKRIHKEACQNPLSDPTIAEVLHVCVRILSLLSLLKDGGDMRITFDAIGTEVLDDLFAFDEKKTGKSKGVPLSTFSAKVNSSNNFVCRHFEKKKETRRFLMPIWDSETDNLLFIPVCSDFLLNGLYSDAEYVEKCETCVNNNDNVYFVMAYGIVRNELCGASASSWVSVPGTQKKLCQKGPKVRNVD